MLEINKIYLGDNLELLKQLEDNSIHSCVSDFPYNLGFMGKKWDTITNYQDWCYQRAIELFRVMKPGGICLIFGGTRTHHRLVCAFEDVGFQIKDEMQWIYGSGFPKSYNISKGFDKKAGAEREVIGTYERPDGTTRNYEDWNDKHFGVGEEKADRDRVKGNEITEPSTDLAKEWDGWGTSLKPAQEPIMVCQKPIEKNYCYNVEKYGVGGINIDDCRIELNGDYKCKANGRPSMTGLSDNYDSGKANQADTIGRFPANIIFDEEASKLLDEQSGISKSKKSMRGVGYTDSSIFGIGDKDFDTKRGFDDKGGASRFFYCAKASTKERNENGLIENKHPTVKPILLIKYLVKLVTPPQGICLDICEGSGTHVRAIQELNKEGFNFNYIGFENDEESFNIACQREELNK